MGPFHKCLENFQASQDFLPSFSFAMPSVSPLLAVKVHLQFDKSMNNALSTKVKVKASFKIGRIGLNKQLEYLTKTRQDFVGLVGEGKTTEIFAKVFWYITIVRLLLRICLTWDCNRQNSDIVI
ncbi:hypothetical protein KC19_3G268900 [Ceratodon purpureus]|uniref:Uncharacterized protein n=1 Tax=Ceratodon purpureus TaxID=3225 RepID=A0A8T0IRG7_CERPU|nr:hypothetical protein KC19_3G268900 [Ceratodon purpureus]